MVKNFRLNIHRNARLFRLVHLKDKKDTRKENRESKNNKHNSTSNKKKAVVRLLESIKDHFITFQLAPDLFTLLYSSLVFKWINNDRLLLIVNNSKTGYQLELFLRSFLLNSVYLDREMPVNTNLHFYNQFIKGKYNIIIANTEYSSNSPQFAKEIVANCPIPTAIIYFNCFSNELLHDHSYNQNTRCIYHFISIETKEEFDKEYAANCQELRLKEYLFDKEQMCHLRYRCEDAYYRIGKLDIKKEKRRKINVELLHSKQMEEYFNQNPKEKENVITAIEENRITNVRPSSAYLPSYLIHQDNNAIADAIRSIYVTGRRNRRRNKRGKMEKYCEALDKGDESHQVIDF